MKIVTIQSGLTCPEFTSVCCGDPRLPNAVVIYAQLPKSEQVYVCLYAADDILEDPWRYFSVLGDGGVCATEVPPDREIYAGVQRASETDENWDDFFQHHAPSRMNCQGGGRETGSQSVIVVDGGVGHPRQSRAGYEPASRVESRS